MQWEEEKDAPNLTLHTNSVSIKSIQRDIMALNKPASYDMIVINESAFIVFTATISINREWARYQKSFKCTFAHIHTEMHEYCQQFAHFMHTMSSYRK